MKILHTADIHLKEDSGERWDALLKIIELGSIEKIDAMIISGDLFDADIDALKLKVKLREIFSGLKYKIYVIPGNHDLRSFDDRAYFGSNVRVIMSVDDMYDDEGVVITGIPFRNIKEQEIFGILQNISVKLDPGKCNILLFHGELIDSYYSRHDFGEEGENRYMPVRLDLFADMNFNYILAGHFHTNFNAWIFDKPGGKGYFVYPGSPVPVTRRETGRRKVNIFKTGGAPSEVFIKTPYYEEVRVKLDPFSSVDPVAEIKSRIDSRNTDARIFLTVEGYINSGRHGIDETALNEKLLKIMDERPYVESCEFKAVDLIRIIEDDIFKAFESELESSNFNQSRKNTIREYFLRAMTESIA